MKTRFIALAGIVASLTLAGCSTPNTLSPALLENIDTVCLVRHPGKKMSDEKLLAALSAGIRSRALNVRIVNGPVVPQDCRLCLYYAVGGAEVETFDVQAVLEEKALPRGIGPKIQNGKISGESVTRAAADYLRQIYQAQSK